MAHDRPRTDFKRAKGSCPRDVLVIGTYKFMYHQTEESIEYGNLDVKSRGWAQGLGGLSLPTKGSLQHCKTSSNTSPL